MLSKVKGSQFSLTKSFVTYNWENVLDMVRSLAAVVWFREENDLKESSLD